MNIVFLGDSVTQGCFEIIKNPAGEWELVIEPEFSYVALIAEKIKKEYPEKDITVINAGISGDSTAEALSRLERDVISHNPAVTAVCLGLNNSGRRNIPEFTSELSEIFKRLAGAGSEIIFMTPNMLNCYVDKDTPDYLVSMAEDCASVQNGGEMDRVIAAAVKTACGHNAQVCDVYAIWKKLAYYGIDTTALLCNHINHPAREMHRLFADELFEILKKKI